MNPSLDWREQLEYKVTANLSSGDEFTSGCRRLGQGSDCPPPLPAAEIFLVSQHLQLSLLGQLPDERHCHVGERLRGLGDCRYRNQEIQEVTTTRQHWSCKQ